MTRFTSIALMFLSAFVPVATVAEIKIGVSAPLTGEAAAWGKDLRNVLEFANQKLSSNRVSFIIEDDRCDPATAVTVAKKFIAVDKVPLVFTVCGAVTLAVGPLYQRSGIVVMAPLATPTRISGLGDHIFRAAISDRFAAKQLAHFIGKHHRKVGVLTEQNEYSVNFLNDFKGYADELGLNLVLEEFNSGENDLRSQLLRLKVEQLDALFINTNVERPFVTALKQMKELKYAPPLYGAYMPGSSAFLKLAGTMAEGIKYVDFPPAEELLNHKGRELYREYENRYGAMQSWSFAFPACFEAFQASYMALTSGETPSKFLHSTSFDGVFGRYSFEKTGDIAGLQHSIKVVRAGQGKSLEKNQIPIDTNAD